MKKPTSALNAWQWTVCLLLLLATMINYMDRQVLSIVSKRVIEQLDLSKSQYGNIEWAFGTAFAMGSLTFGYTVDRVAVRWLYPFVLLAWSAVGFATGFVWNYSSLMACRTLLGFFEAGHWPCALVVVQLILSKQDRAFGNSILQSGASIGAILTPLVIALIFRYNTDAEAWRQPFQFVGCVGALWAVLWIVVIPKRSLLRLVPPPEKYSTARWLNALVRSKRFWAMAIMVVGINTSWQLIRAWLPLFLQEGRGYSESAATLFNAAYYLATDVGCIAAGTSVMMLSHRGRSVHSARVLTYTVCACLTCLTCVAVFLNQGPLLLGILLIVGAGSLGMFPCYYSFNQELSDTNLGKTTGVLSFIGWMAASPVHRLFGSYVDHTHSYDLGLALVGLFPLAGLFALYFLWPKDS
ncbi:MAG: MFS transporter [Pirellula sp.]